MQASLEVVRLRRKRSHGFNLIEVTVALAIISFSCTCLLGLLPASMNAFHQAMLNTIESQIVQSTANDLELDNFSTLTTYASAPPTCYYDHEGQVLPDSTGYFYKAQLTFDTVTGSNSPADLTPKSTTTIPAYRIKVSITSVAQASPHVYTLIIANNGL